MQKEFKITPDLYASSGQRLANLFIDTIMYYILLIVVSAILGVVLALIGGMALVNTIVDSSFFNIAVTYGTILLYFIVFEFFLQKSIGKYLSKTIVVNENGEKPTLKQIVGRTFSRFIPFDAFSYLGSSVRGWHDTLPNVYVVDEKLFQQKKRNFYDFKELGKNEEEFTTTKDTDLEVRF